MLNWIKKSLKAKVVLFSLLVATVPAAVVGYWSFHSAKAGLEKSVFRELEEAQRRGAQAVVDYIRAAMLDLDFLAQTWSVQSAFEILSFFQESAEKSKANEIDLNSEEYKKAIVEIDQLFERWMKLYGEKNGYEDLLIVVGRSRGRVILSQQKLSDLGENTESALLKDSALTSLWKKVVETKKPAIVDFTHYPPIDGPAAFLGVPVRSQEKFVGVAVLRIGTKKIDSLMGVIGKKGGTGDAFVIGRDFTMRSHSRLTKDSVLKQKVDTLPAKQAVQGLEGTGIVQDYRGHQVLESWASVGLKKYPELGADFDWGVIAKMDVSEAFSSVTTLANKIILIVLGIAVAVALVAYRAGTYMAKPITAVASQAVQISEGNLGIEVATLNRSDELGEMATAFRNMASVLRKQMVDVQNGLKILNRAATNITDTVSDVSGTIGQMSTAISETTTTVEQVKQAARLASEKAAKVTGNSHQVASISSSGQKATEDTITKMNGIKDQMESIRETVARLTEHSQAIHDIIEVVQDLAEQSNLLAVNASIEAARAGDHGKGFTIVAHEIKTLAEQSKEATAQIRSILEETRRWVSEVEMATEQGSKAVNEGLHQSELAGESIVSLSESVTAASDAATVIESAVSQQFVGVEQVSNAMQDIEKAMRKNLDATSEMEALGKQLKELGSNLVQLVQYYRI